MLSADLRHGSPRRGTVLDAPSNLGLAPPAPGRKPGTRRMPDVLRWNDLRTRLGVLGNLLGARRHVERLGLVFLDGHSDFATPERSGTHGAAGMDLALAVGLGPVLLSRLAPDGPVVDAGSVVHLGLREDDPSLRTSGIAVLDLAAIERAGPPAIAARVLEHLAGFWIHLDADVLHEDIMPAVDSRAPGGLSYEALVEALRP